MIFKLHYCFQTPAVFTFNLLVRLFILDYSDASLLEVRVLFIIMPFAAAITRIVICSWADRNLNHRECLMGCLAAMLIGYVPIIVIPFLGPEIYLGQHARVCFYTLAACKILVEIALGASVSVGDSLANNYARLFKEDYNYYRVWGLASWLCLAALISVENDYSHAPRYVPVFIILALFSTLHMTLIWLWPKRECVLLPPAPSQVAHGQKQSKSPPKIFIFSPQMDLIHVDLQLGVTSREDIENEKNLDAATQLRIMRSLARADPRVALHLLFFVCMGLILSPFDFFFRDLAINFQHRAEWQYDLQFGLFQAAIAAAATLLYFQVRSIRASTGRVGMFALFTSLASAHYMFYGLAWNKVNLYNALAAELIAGIMSAIYISTTVESGDVFANEVPLLLPELVISGVVKQTKSFEKVKLALAATTGALVSFACDGIGRGLAAIIYNLALDKYAFKDVALTVGICSMFLTTLIMAIDLMQHILKIRLGVDCKRCETTKSHL